LGDQHGESFLFGYDGLGDVINDSLKNTFNTDSFVLEIFNSPAVFSRCVVNGVIEEVILTFEIAEHFEDLINDFTHSG
jgi:hypothetical protein